LSPRGELCPLGAKLSSGGCNSLYAPPFFLTVECSPLGVNEGVKIPLRDKFHPRGPGVKLRMSLYTLEGFDPTIYTIGRKIKMVIWALHIRYLGRYIYSRILYAY
jgi:hypothetical protein